MVKQLQEMVNELQEMVKQLQEMVKQLADAAAAGGYILWEMLLMHGVALHVVKAAVFFSPHYVLILMT
jgi:Skp family chaperone for outer membrane proteins